MACAVTAVATRNKRNDDRSDTKRPHLLLSPVLREPTIIRGISGLLAARADLADEVALLGAPSHGVARAVLLSSLAAGRGS